MNWHCEGKRLKSETPKVLHPICGRPALWHVLQAGLAAKPTKVIVVVSDDPDLREDASYSFPSEYQVVLANDARDALRVMESHHPVLAIVDIKT